MTERLDPRRFETFIELAQPLPAGEPVYISYEVGSTGDGPVHLYNSQGVAIPHHVRVRDRWSTWMNLKPGRERDWEIAKLVGWRFVDWWGYDNDAADEIYGSCLTSPIGDNFPIENIEELEFYEALRRNEHVTHFPVYPADNDEVAKLIMATWKGLPNDTGLA